MSMEERLGRNIKKSLILISLIPLFSFLAFSFTAGTRGIMSGERYDELVIRNVMMIDGKGTPVKGPVDIVVTKNIIQSIRAPQEEEKYDSLEHVIDGTGLYVLPGLINLHAHIHDNRGGKPLPFEYIYKLWLACGITSIRDVGSNYEKTLEERKKSREGRIAAPRIFLYMTAWGRTPEEIQKRIQDIKAQEGDGVKIFGMDRDIMKAAMEKAHELDLRVAHHVGVEETDAWDDAAMGVTTVEHWYGIPDAALHGSQNFPSWYNYSHESDRFRYAGRLWREADQEKLGRVLEAMVENGVSWCPTFVIYEANRDLLRAQNQPWFKEYLHPVVEEYFKPNPAFHGSYHWDWTTTDEIYWRENFRIWMDAVNRFSRMGGIVGCGEDAGYIYMLYGFSLIRELELHQEAGFHPIDVIMHATGNNAKILGMEDRLGRIRVGYSADLILVQGNPLKNLKYLYPTGVVEQINGKLSKTGGVMWTIKEGFVYDSPSLLEEVRKIVADARGEED
jgi:imidazolonepropionase-like amidohydrolase